MFSIKLAINHSEKNKIGKNIEPLITLNGNLKESCDLVNPSIMIQYNGVINCNYAIIEEFNRKYFVTKITNEGSNLWRLDLHCDVLDSFSEEILSNRAIIGRSKGLYNLYINDPNCVVEEDTLTYSYKPSDVVFDCARNNVMQYFLTVQ